MSSDEALKFADKLQAAIDNWISRKRGLANTVGADKEALSEVNIVIDLHGKSYEFSSLQAVPPEIMNQWIAHHSKQELANPSVKDQRNHGDRKKTNSRVTRRTGVCCEPVPAATTARGFRLITPPTQALALKHHKASLAAMTVGRRIF